MWQGRESSSSGTDGSFVLVGKLQVRWTVITRWMKRSYQRRESQDVDGLEERKGKEWWSQIICNGGLLIFDEEKD